MTTSNEHNNAPAVPQGRSVWLLVREDDESDAVMMYFEKPDETGFKDRFKLREFVLVERATTAPAPAQLTDEERQQVFKAAERRMVREPNLSWRDAIVDEVIAALRAKGQS